MLLLLFLFLFEPGQKRCMATLFLDLRKLNLLEAGIAYVAGHKGDLKKGSLFMTSQFTTLLKNPRPFFLVFDEFHLKKIPAWRFESWKVMVVAIATLEGQFMRFVHIQMESLNFCLCFFRSLLLPLPPRAVRNAIDIVYRRYIGTVAVQ